MLLVQLTDIFLRNCFIEGASLSRKSFINSIKFSFPWNLVKFANVCNVLAINVKFLAAFSLGYSKTKLWLMTIHEKLKLYK